MSTTLLSAPVARPHRQPRAACSCTASGTVRRSGRGLQAPSPWAAHRLSHRRTFPPLAAAAVEEVPAAAEEDDVSVDELKAQLLDSLFGTERGLAATSEVRAEINELVTQLEARNPNPSLEQAAEMLNGRWKLVYAANSGVLGLLALARLPGVAVGEITQTIDSASLTVENQVQLSGPFSRTALSTSASYEIRSPKRLQVRFERGTVATPELLQDVELPASVSVMGQSIDLTPVKDALAPVNSAARDAVSQLQRVLGQQPEFSFPITAAKAQTWLINTFLDEDTRVSRGDGGAVFVLVKEVPARLNSLRPKSGGGGEPRAEDSAPPESDGGVEPRVEGPVAAAEGQGF